MTRQSTHDERIDQIFRQSSKVQNDEALRTYKELAAIRNQAWADAFGARTSARKGSK